MEKLVFLHEMLNISSRYT